MSNNFDEKITNRYVKNRRAKIRARVITVLCCLVVVATGVVLMLPANTQSQPTFCGYEEHVHTDECYQKVGEKTLVCEITEGTPAHVHDDSCYEIPLSCGLEESDGHVHSDACLGEEKVLSCGLEESDGHVHSDACRSDERVLSCTLPEDPGHVHGPSCYSYESVSCPIPESDGHQHAEGCYDAEGNLICGMNEGDGAHHHDASCTYTVETLICGIPEGEGAHTHNDSCYTVNSVLTCGIPEGDGAHHHSDSCYTVSQTYTCGHEEQAAHHHDESCYAGEPVLICEESTEPHIHTDECYEQEKILVCDKPVHEHTLVCFSNPTADLENSEVWNRFFEDLELTGDWSEDVITVAKTQLGYTESSANYLVDDNGETTHGYTRYGAWYGYPYSDWCAMFCSFVYHYAGVDSELMPNECVCSRWVELLAARGLYHPETDYAFRAGDLIFFDTDRDGIANHVGLVDKYDEVSGLLTTIEGNRTRNVNTFDYYLNDDTILGYGELPVNPELADTLEPVPDAPYAAEVTPELNDGTEADAEAAVEEALPEKPECTCGAAEGEPHAEDCPVYAYELALAEKEAAAEAEALEKPECTCGAAEGEPHAEDCPVYAYELALAEKEAAEEETLTVENPEEAGVASLPADDGAYVTLEGEFPEDFTSVLDRVTFTDDELTEIFGTDKAAVFNSFAAYRISASSAGASWQPGESAVHVTLKNSSFAPGEWDSIAVCLFDSETEEVRYLFSDKDEDGNIGFDTNEFTVVMFYSCNPKSHVIESEPADDGAVAVVTGIIPEGADVLIDAVHLTEDELIMYFGPAQAAAMKDYVAYDIRIMVGDVEWQPSEFVTVDVIHPAIEVSDEVRVGVAHVDGETGEVKTVETEVASDSGEVSVEFDANGFSLYIFYTFTVDFHFGDITFSIEGRTQITLSELFRELGILRDASQVVSLTFSDPSLVAVEKIEGDWLLKSLLPFSSDETLTMTFSDGEVLTLHVTDAQTTYWKKVESIDELSSDGVYMIVYGNKAFGVNAGQNNSYSSAAGSNALTSMSSYPGYYSSTLSDDYKWSITGTGTSGYYVITSRQRPCCVSLAAKDTTSVFASTLDTDARSTVRIVNSGSDSYFVISGNNYRLRYSDSGSSFKSSTYTSNSDFNIYRQVANPQIDETETGPEIGTVELIKKEPTHSKYIDSFRDEVPNPDTDIDSIAEKEGSLDDFYRLYLDIGVEEAYKAVDLMVVLDLSNSMTESDAIDINGNSSTRINAVLSMLNGSSSTSKKGLVQTLFEINENNRFAITGFASDKQSSQFANYTRFFTKSDLINDDGSLKNSFSFTAASDAYGGTNYVAGLQNAHNLWNTNTGENEKIMIFLSDGIPTFYYNGLDGSDKDYTNGYKYNKQTYPWRGDGRETDDNTKKYTNEAIAAFKNAHSNVMIYSLGVGDFTKTYLDTLSKDSNGNPQTYSSRKFNDILRLIEYKITDSHGRYSNLKVEDTLSENVDFYTAQTDLLIQVIEKKSDGIEQTTVLYENGGWTSAKSGYIDSESPDNPIDTANKKVTVKFDKAMKEKGDTIYRISFNVQTTDLAKEKFYSTGHTDVGDPGTDYPKNDTSSNHPGFFSNKQATLSYNQTLATDTPDYTKPDVCFFDMPVIQVTSGSESEDPEESTDGPVVSKWIDALREGPDNPDTAIDNDLSSSQKAEKLADNYRLYLNVGPEFYLRGVDILFVIDESSSMKTQDAYKVGSTSKVSRREALNDLLNSSGQNLIDKLLSMNPKNKYAIVGFSDKGYVRQYWSNSYVQYDVRMIQGTNYIGGLYQAKQLLNDVSADGNDKVVIFISDGEPTVFFDNNNIPNGSLIATFSNVSNDSLTYRRNSKSTLKEYTNSAVSSFTNSFKDVDIFSLYIGKTLDSKEYPYLKNLSTDDSVLVSTDMGKLMKTIDNKITYGHGHYRNITVKDKLSEYVDFDRNHLDLVIQKIPDGQQTGTGEDILYKGSVTNGNLQITDGSGNYLASARIVNNGFTTVNLNGEIVQSVSIDFTNKVIQIKYQDTFQEVGGICYSTSFNVVATQKAYDDFAANAVDDTKANGYDGMFGQEGTDYAGTRGMVDGNYLNQTSSNKPGFRSNADSYDTGNKDKYNARVEYVQYFEGDPNGTPNTSHYPHPVIQVSKKDIEVQKQWLDNADHDSDVVEYTLYRRRTGSKDENAWKVYTTIRVTKGSDPANRWKGSFNNLVIGPYGYEYKVDETGVFDKDGKELDYSFTVTETLGVSNGEGGTKDVYLFRNQPKTAEITFTKSDEQLNPIRKAGVTFELYEDKDLRTKYRYKLPSETEAENYLTQFVSDDSGVVTIPGVEVDKVYWLKETKSPDGYNMMRDTPAIMVKYASGSPKLFLVTFNEKNEPQPVEISSSGNISVKEKDGTVYVVNSSGYELPKTGGPGMEVFYISGALLMACALIYGFSVSKKQEGRHVR